MGTRSDYHTHAHSLPPQARPMLTRVQRMLERVQRMPTRLRLPCMHATFCCRRAAAALSIPCALSSALRPHSFCQTGWVERRCQRKRGCSHTGATRSEGICMVGRTQGPCRPRRCSGMHNAMQMGGCFHNGTAEQQACRAQVWPSLLLAPVLIACCEVFTLSKFAISRDRLAPIGPSCPRVPCLDAAGLRAVGRRPHADPYRVPDTAPGSISSTLCSTHGCRWTPGRGRPCPTRRLPRHRRRAWRRSRGSFGTARPCCASTPVRVALV